MPPRRPATLSRRALLAGAACAAAPAGARAPEVSPRPMPRGLRADGSVVAAPRPPSVETLLEEAGLGPAQTAFAVADAGTGAPLEGRGAERPLPPASVAKAITALYALDRLGPAHRFATRVLATGPLRGGRLAGDLILAGSGDPLLQTNDLADLAAALRAAGVTEVAGALRLWDGALPRIDRIDPGQPDHVGYSPALSGLNLNFNRVHFEWRATGAGHAVSMDARSDRFRPEVRMARMRVVDRAHPVYTYADGGDVDDWTVAAGALGGAGSRWLPVRKPALYAGDVFRTLARGQGIAVGAPRPLAALPADARVLAEVTGAPLRAVLEGMLRFSTNVTAEAVGLAATRAGGRPAPDLQASGARMADWLAMRAQVRRPDFVDHSGLGDASRIAPADMVRALLRLGPRLDLAPLLRDLPLRDAAYREVAGSPVRIAAKTGTLNFVSGLAGYVTAPGGRRLAFAIFSADLPRRAAIPRARREGPPGAAGWARRARILQMRLIDRWARVHA